MTHENHPRSLRPGERIIDGQVVYSAAFLDDPMPAVLTPDEAEVARRTDAIRSYDMARGVRVPKGRRRGR